MEQRQVSEPATVGASAGATVAPTSPSADAYGDLFSFVASHCYADELGPTPYTTTWLNHGHSKSQVGEHAVYPVRDGKVFPEPGTRGANERAARLRKAWLTNPTSHVVDCWFIQDGPFSQIEQLRSNYVAYLPAALFQDPAKVRGLLVLVPGGNGGRSRPFLTPLLERSKGRRGWGGLETQRRVDEWLGAHPEATPTIVVALQSTGEELRGGAINHLTRGLPAHFAKAYLGGASPADLALGLEGTSSGARPIVKALYAHPEAIASVGLSGLSCGAIDFREGRIAPKEKVAKWSEDLAARTARGDLRIRFAIGARDGQLRCNRALYEMWADAGVFDRTKPREERACVPSNRRKGKMDCDVYEDGFTTYGDALHDYGFVSRSYPEQLEFHLAALSDIARRKKNGAPTPER